MAYPGISNLPNTPGNHVIMTQRVMTPHVIFSRLGQTLDTQTGSGVEPEDLDYLRNVVNSMDTPFSTMPMPMPSSNPVQVQAVCPEDLLQQYIKGRAQGQEVALTQITIPGPMDPNDKQFTPQEMKNVQAWMEDQYQEHKAKQDRDFARQLSGLFGDGHSGQPVQVRKASVPAHSKRKDKMVKSVREEVKAPVSPAKQNTRDVKEDKPKPRPKKKATLESRNDARSASGPAKRTALEEVRASMGRGSDYLLEAKYAGAILAYQNALDKSQELETENKSMFPETDQVLLRFSLAYAFLENGSKKDVHEAVKLYLYIISNHRKVTFPAVFLSLGKAYYIQKKFDESCVTLKEGLKFYSQQKEFCWPGIKKKIVFTAKDKLRDELRYWLDASAHPPKSDAVCLAKKTTGHMKINIYLGDPDCKGFVRLTCFAACKIEYHPECWKKILSEDKKSSDRELLNTACFTPDCPSLIDCIILYDNEGESKRKLGPLPRPEKLPPANNRPRLKTRPSSQQTIDKRTEKKTRRKQRKTEVQEMAQRTEKVSEVIGQLEQAAAASSSNEEAQAGTSVELPPSEDIAKFATVLKKEDDEPQAAGLKAVKKKKKDKTKKVMSLGEFVGNQDEEEDEDMYITNWDEGAMGMDDFEVPSGQQYYPRLDPEAPFTVPEQLRDSIEAFEHSLGHSGAVASSNVYGDYPKTSQSGLSTRLDSVAFVSLSRSQSSDGSRRGSEASSILQLSAPVVDSAPVQQAQASSGGSDRSSSLDGLRDFLYSFFADILNENGPLCINDVLIHRQVEEFPEEVQAVIRGAGGIGQLLGHNIQFTMVEDYICLVQDEPKARQLVQENKKSLVEKYRLELASSMTAPLKSRKKRGKKTANRNNISATDMPLSAARDLKDEDDLTSERSWPGSENSGQSELSGVSKPRHLLDSTDLIGNNTNTRPDSVSSSASDMQITDEREELLFNNAHKFGLRFGSPLNGSAEKDAVFESPARSQHSRIESPDHKSPGLIQNQCKDMLSAGINSDNSGIRMEPTATTDMFEQRNLGEVDPIFQLVHHQQQQNKMEELINAPIDDLTNISIPDNTKKRKPRRHGKAKIAATNMNLLEHIDYDLQSEVETKPEVDNTTKEVNKENNFPSAFGSMEEMQPHLYHEPFGSPTLQQLGIHPIPISPPHAIPYSPPHAIPYSPPHPIHNTPPPPQPIHTSPPQSIHTSPPHPIPMNMSNPFHYPAPSIIAQHVVRPPVINHLPCVRLPYPISPPRPFNGGSPFSSSGSSSSLGVIGSPLVGPRAGGDSLVGPPARCDRSVNTDPCIMDWSEVEALLEQLEGEKCKMQTEQRHLQEDLEKERQTKMGLVRKQGEQMEKLVGQMEVNQAEGQQTLTQEREQHQLQFQALNVENDKLKQHLHSVESVIHSFQVKQEQLETELNSCKAAWESDRQKAEVDRQENFSTVRNLSEKYGMDLLRAERAEVSLVKYQLDVAMSKYNRRFEEADQQVQHYSNMIQHMNTDGQNPAPPELVDVMNNWIKIEDDIRTKQDQCRAVYENQIRLIKRGEALTTQPPVMLNEPPELPRMHKQRNEATPPQSFRRNIPPGFAVSQGIKTTPVTVGNGHGALPPAKSSQKKNSFEKIVNSLSAMFPNYRGTDIKQFIMRLRELHGGTLSGMMSQEIITRVAEMIVEDSQHRMTQGLSVPPPSATPWTPKVNFQAAAVSEEEIFEEEEDPCVICHDELTLETQLQVACGHRFHNVCIRRWLQEQRTCPTCREHILLQEDFPRLG